MNFREKLSRLSAPVTRAPATAVAHAAETRLERERRVEREQTIERERANGDSSLRDARDLESLGVDEFESSAARELDQPGREFKEPRRLSTPNQEGKARAKDGSEFESESERAERISHLRSLIGEVLARGATWRAPHAGAIGLEDAHVKLSLSARPGELKYVPRDAGSPRVRECDTPPAITDRLGQPTMRGDDTFAGTLSKSAGARDVLLAAIAGAQRAATRAFEMNATFGAEISLVEDTAFARDGVVERDGAVERDGVAARDGVVARDGSRSERNAVAEDDAFFAQNDASRDTTSFSLRTRAHRVDMLREAIDGWAPARGRLARVFARQPWATRETPFGPVHVVERWLEPAHLHGTIAVHSALERLPATVAALALDPELANLDFSRMLFLDTETTGLMGGSGTVAFLVGIASFHDDSLLLTQLLLPNLGGEVPMLNALAEHLASASCILTYNGKSFDWPLLRTRYVMNRLPVPALPPHVDLLHASRRIWKPRLGSVRLTDVEREIMRFSREGDVDGAEIPSRYFSFLRDGGTDWLVPVLEHNQNDLIALPAMLGVLGERFEHIECGDHALDALAYGRLALRVADGERAAAFALAAVTASEGSPLESQAWSFRGEVARRAREAEVAVQHYEQALELCAEELRSAALHVLLSKLYEHGLRDLRAAYRHARHTEPAEGPELQGRRLGRLTRKLEREGEREAAKRRRALRVRLHQAEGQA